MIQFDEALQAILEQTQPLNVIQRPLKECLGYTIAEPVIAMYDHPFFNNSAMDGYGVKSEDIENASKDSPVLLTIKETIQAGDYSETELTSNSAVKLFTGAPTPPGVNAVVMKEFCTEKEGRVLIHRPAKINENIRFQGEEFQKGQTVIAQGTTITPPVVGFLANLGSDQVKVYRKPKVSLLVTGNELIAPGRPLQPGQIYDSNSYALTAALNEMGINPVPVFYTKDDQAETRQKLNLALADQDVVITLGGISVGDYDFVKEVVEAEGVETVFWRIAIKPGKPVYFGRQQQGGKNQLIFGLPGNPVSALVTFHQLIRPALLNMMGIPPHFSIQKTTAQLETPLKKRAGRLEFVRGICTADQKAPSVRSTQGQSSHMLSGLTTANCLIHFPEEQTTLNPGDPVMIEPLHWR